MQCARNVADRFRAYQNATVDSVPRRFDDKQYTSDAIKGSCKGQWADKAIKTRRVWYRFIQSDGGDVSVAGGYRVWCVGLANGERGRHD
jgi:hypothetical protein